LSRSRLRLGDQNGNHNFYKDLKAKLDQQQGITVIETLAPERYREAGIPGARREAQEQYIAELGIVPSGSTMRVQ
jgi:hypothetical protein